MNTMELTIVESYARLQVLIKQVGEVAKALRVLYNQERDMRVVDTLRTTERACSVLKKAREYLEKDFPDVK